MENAVELAGRRVLIVEDDFLLAMELEALVEGGGGTVIGSVSSVQQALIKLDHELPDVALLDVNLKGERATPVAGALQARGVPFVVITGYSNQQLTEPELRAAPRLEKPVNAGDLRHALLRALALGDPGSLS